MAKIKVLQVDQWTSTGNITDLSLENFELEKVEGGDSEAAKNIFGGHAIIREVNENDEPSIGYVWFKTRKKTGKLVFWKAHYDSGD